MSSPSNLMAEAPVLVSYLVILLLLGPLFKKLSKSSVDFFVSGGQGPWWLVGMSMFMSNLSTLTFTGNAGIAFASGWSVLIIYVSVAAATLVRCGFLAAWFRQSRVVTFPELLRERFGPATQLFYAVFSVVTFLMIAGIWLWGLSVFSSAVFGLPVRLVIVTLGLVLIFYSAVGGRWALMASDFTQGLLLLFMAITVATLCLWKAGGPEAFMAEVASPRLADDFQVFKAGDSGSFTWRWALAIFVTQLVLQNSANNAMRYFSAKDGSEAKKAAWFYFALQIVGASVFFIPPVFARIYLEPEVTSLAVANPADASYAIASGHVLPKGMLGLIVVAMFGAALSSMDTGLNGNSAMAVRDILPRLLRLLRLPELSDSKALFLGRAFTVFFGLSIMGLALYYSQRSGAGIFETVLGVTAVLSIPLSVPLLLGLFIKKTPPWAALFSVAGGLLPSLIAWVTGNRLAFEQTVFFGLACGCIAFLATRFLPRSSSAEYRSRVDAFMKRLRTQIDYEKEVGKSQDQFLMRTLGFLACAIGGLCLLLLLVPNPLEGRITVLAFSSSFLVAGLILLACGFRPLRKANINPSAAASESRMSC